MKNSIFFFVFLFLSFWTANAGAENLSVDKNLISRMQKTQVWVQGVGTLGDEISDMSAWDYIDFLKAHTVVVIYPVHVVIHDVEMTEVTETNGYDIPYFPLDVPEAKPYLLSVLDSKEPCARPTVSLLSKLPTERSTVGLEALRLLKAIKLQSYHPLKISVTEAEKPELIAWAHEEMDKFEKLYGYRPVVPNP